jgi:hypothetical protein
MNKIYNYKSFKLHEWEIKMWKVKYWLGTILGVLAGIYCTMELI